MLGCGMKSGRLYVLQELTAQHAPTVVAYPAADCCVHTVLPPRSSLAPLHCACMLLTAYVT